MRRVLPRCSQLVGVLALTLIVLLLARRSRKPTETSAETDREALIALYNAADGDNWDDNDNWLSDESLDEWGGVTTDANGRVIKLDLGFNQLSGEIPPDLGNLAIMEELYLQENQLSGEIPPELGNLANLYALAVAGNQLSGEIPPELSNLGNLTWLALWGNQLSGKIPPELSNLARLDALLLSRNQLSGEIPPELSGLANLTWLSL